MTGPFSTFFTPFCGSLTLMSRLCLRPTAHIYSYRFPRLAYGSPKLPASHIASILQ